MVDPKNKILKTKHIRRGLSILLKGRSPFWLIRLRDSQEKRYVHRSSKETSRVEAMDAALEFADSYQSKSKSFHAPKKTSSFEAFAIKLIALQRGQSKWSSGDNKLLNRPKDGLIYYFGKHDVSKITTGMVRDYLVHLDGNRKKPLASSTKSKHVIIIRKVLALAVEDGFLNVLPVMPKIKTVDTPRHSFTDSEYKKFMTTALECARRGDVVRGITITSHHVRMFRFIVHSFLRPTEGELFGIKNKDIQQKSNPTCLTSAPAGQI